MSASDSSRRSWSWLVIAMAAVVLYVLSVGPASLIADKYPATMGVLNAFYAPIIWLHANTFLEKPLDVYVELWRGK